ncbi:hypothetical protein [Seonamhaeicola marinus]|uniref:3-keto-disaccharide hydrolase domain-containing protein n=1 Tax=Seonamhaeicola marinus TaxID=1912246 RepID=A0A5D0HST6_9FLAO|nr:hypothetical protein [Seonamhaeicola marinus]TYA74366.1 hypothetical protein FUA24_13660 [Seonamhaeicola marinus]
MTTRLMPFLLVFVLFFGWLSSSAQSGSKKTTKGYGTLIFSDAFERSESQELKDELGNNWTTSSDKTAKGHKQVDIRNGHVHIYIHEEANHAVSVRHEMGFKDGAIGIDFKLDHKDDVLVLNIADPSCKSVHAGHIINVKIKANTVEIYDLKTGIFNLDIKRARKEKSLTESQKALLKTKVKRIPNTLKLNDWHTAFVKIEGDTLWVYIDAIEIGRFSSDGINHHAKDLLRILVPRKVTVDNLNVWKNK